MKELNDYQYLQGDLDPHQYKPGQSINPPGGRATAQRQINAQKVCDDLAHRLTLFWVRTHQFQGSGAYNHSEVERRISEQLAIWFATKAYFKVRGNNDHFTFMGAGRKTLVHLRNQNLTTPYVLTPDDIRDFIVLYVETIKDYLLEICVTASIEIEYNPADWETWCIHHYGEVVPFPLVDVAPIAAESGLNITKKYDNIFNYPKRVTVEDMCQYIRDNPSVGSVREFIEKIRFLKIWAAREIFYENYYI